jgi:hypothetical protein
MNEITKQMEMGLGLMSFRIGITERGTIVVNYGKCKKYVLE